MTNTHSTITVSAKLLEPFMQLARHYPQTDGSDISLQLLQLAKITEAEFNKPGARFPEDKFPLILQKLQSITSNPLVALSLGEATQPQMLGSLGFLMSTAPNLELAYQILTDYLPLIHEGAVLQLEKSVDGIELTFELHDNHPGIVSFFLSCLINWPRHLTGQQVAAKHVYLNCPEPADKRLYQQHFAAEVSFDQPRNQLLINSEYLNLSCVDANAEMHQLHREFADSLMSKIGVQNALTARTRNLIRQHLSGNNGLIRREQVASELGLSLRTLQRKLGNLGSSFQDIYDETRKEICLQLIQRGEHSFGEISYQLGFSNQSAFQKAFKRWMNTTPSEYRSRIKPEQVEIASAKPETTTTSWLNQSDFTELLIQKTDHLSQFSCQLLEWASLCGDDFSLEEISTLTGDPIARLAIYLWPSEQSGLIICTDDPGDRTHFRFADVRIRQHFLERQNETQLIQRHGDLARAMLGQTNLSQQTAKLFTHIEKARSLFSAKECEAILKIALQTSEDLAAAGDFRKASYYQSQALALISVESTAEYEKQYWRLAELLFLSGEAKSAQEMIDQSDCHSQAKPLLQARIYQHQGSADRALEHLLKQPVNRLLPKDESAQLLFLVEQTEHHRARLENIDAEFQNLAESSQQEHYQQFLEQIALLAREQKHPLLAACAICLMVKDTFEYGRTSHSAFAFASFAWVAGWFCADIKLARKAADASRLVLNAQQGQIPLSSPLAQNQDPSLILSSQVEHWLVPLNKVQRNLSELEHSCRLKHHWLELIDVLTLSFQMSIYRPGSLNLEQLEEALEDSLEPIRHPDLEHKKNQVREEILSALNQLRGRPGRERDSASVYGLSACSQIVNALVLNEQSSWAKLLLKVDQLEQSLPGYFSHTEALFATTLMRAILAQKQQGFSRKGQIEFTRQHSRIEIWAEQMPENFATQNLLIKAEKARLSDEDPTPFYEAVLSECQISEAGYITPLCYQRYADYLITQQQNHLGRFCLAEACRLYQQWGATKAAKIVEQQLSLLAK
ncbi:AraC family transcriptional regulator ligand-binding domain-containing protein [Neptuniibacter caesariensis]|nr:AraC family transcriptional regulator ligand-binding domain-containing protein [Neptuniibacter caesariensis]